MAIIFPEGTQDYPSNVVQIKATFESSVIVAQNLQLQWQDMWTWTGAITTKSPSSTILLQSAFNWDVLTGTGGHFWRWLYSANGGSYNFLGSGAASPGNRVPAHYAGRTQNGTDPIMRSPIVVSSGWNAGTTFNFKLQCWMISGAERPVINRSAGDGDNTNNCRTTSGVMVYEVN